MKLPEEGSSKEDVVARIREMKTGDADWRGGRTWSLIYPAGEEVDEVIRAVADLYLFENALNPFKFPSLRTMERDVVSMTGEILSAPDGFGGSMTSGGTESILMAVKTARDRARAEKGVASPKILIPYSAHPAFAKAGTYLGLEVEQIPLGDDLRADVDAAKKMVSEQTVLIVGSAPNYPHGVIDPIGELAAIASENGIAFHTDSCVGGFLLPFMEQLGHPVPSFDFRVDGVTSMSADVHKYGYATKGASVILHRNGAHLEYQSFVYSQWPGGTYGSYAMAGARPALPIAVSWAVMNYLGREGYQRLVRRIMDAVRHLREGIEAIPGLRIFGDPAASVLSFGSSDFDIFGAGDAMDEKGWHLDRQTDPDALHMMVSPEHSKIVGQFLADLSDAVAQGRSGGSKQPRYS